MGMTQNFKQIGPQIVVILKSWKSQFDAYIPSTMSAQAAAYPSLFLVSSIAASRLFSSLLGPRSGGIPWGWGEWLAKVNGESWGISFFKGAPESQVTKDDRSHNVAWLLHLVVFYPQSLHCRVQLPWWSCDTAACLQQIHLRSATASCCGSFLRLSRSLLLSSSQPKVWVLQ